MHGDPSDFFDTHNRMAGQVQERADNSRGTQMNRSCSSTRLATATLNASLKVWRAAAGSASLIPQVQAQTHLTYVFTYWENLDGWAASSRPAILGNP